MGTFPLPPPPRVANIYPINVIYFFTSGSLRFSDPWVLPHPEDVESYGTLFFSQQLRLSIRQSH
jgi:hypothetical protein